MVNETGFIRLKVLFVKPDQNKIFGNSSPFLTVFYRLTVSKQKITNTLNNSKLLKTALRGMSLI